MDGGGGCNFFAAVGIPAQEITGGGGGGQGTISLPEHIEAHIIGIPGGQKLTVSAIYCVAVIGVTALASIVIV